MINNAYYSQDAHGPYELHDIGNLELEEGGTIRGCQLAYATFGTLNAAKDNAVEYLCLGLTRSLISRMNHLPLTVKSFSLVSNFAGSAQGLRLR